MFIFVSCSLCLILARPLWVNSGWRDKCSENRVTRSRFSSQSFEGPLSHKPPCTASLLHQSICWSPGPSHPDSWTKPWVTYSHPEGRHTQFSGGEPWSIFYTHTVKEMRGPPCVFLLFTLYSLSYCSSIYLINKYTISLWSTITTHMIRKTNLHFLFKTLPHSSTCQYVYTKSARDPTWT